jgi:hypothetical protein
MIQQKGVDPPLGVGGGELFIKAFLRLLDHNETVSGGRGLVVQPRQHLALGGHLRVHPAKTFDDPPLPVQQYQVGPAAHGLQHQCPAAGTAEVVGDVQLQPDQPFQGRLGKTCDLCPGQVLAQQHTEHGRLRRVVPDDLCQLNTGGIGPGIQQQPPAPQQQNHLVPGGLLHLVDAQAQQLGPQLLHHRLQADRV